MLLLFAEYFLLKWPKGRCWGVRVGFEAESSEHIVVYDHDDDFTVENVQLQGKGSWHKAADP